jgi:hypothetical protein
MDFDAKYLVFSKALTEEFLRRMPTPSDPLLKKGLENSQHLLRTSNKFIRWLPITYSIRYSFKRTARLTCQAILQYLCKN